MRQEGQHRIVNVLPPSSRFARGVLLFLSVSNLLFGVGTAQLSFLPLAPLWGLWYGLAAVSCFWAARRFGNPWSVSVAGAATVTAHSMRGLVLVWAWSIGRAPDGVVGWGIVTGCTAWWTLAVLSAAMFIRGIGPLAHLHSHGR